MPVEPPTPVITLLKLPLTSLLFLLLSWVKEASGFPTTARADTLAAIFERCGVEIKSTHVSS